MTPPLARVGITQRDAEAACIEIRVAAMRVTDMSTVPRARIVSESDGMMKVIVDAASDQILGAAAQLRLARSHQRDGIYTHPSMSEAFNQLLGALHA